MRVELRADTVVDILVDLGVLDPGRRPTIRALSGGVANAVLSVRWDGGAVVAKQALPRLRVAADWSFDTARTRIERDCLAYLGRVLPPGSVPSVVAFDAASDVLVISEAPDGGANWKDRLLAGDVDPAVGARVGALLGRLHHAAAGDPEARERFAEHWPLVQGRVDPFHRTVAGAHPELAEVIRLEVERLLATRATLVLGDCSPKNVISYPDRVVLLDFEVAHWGDPAFDVAFLLCHLVLKARHRPECAAALRECASAFADAHRAAGGALPMDDAAVVAELGCLLLSRVDGKSPTEYLRDPRDHAAVRDAAMVLLLEAPESRERALDAAFEAIARGVVTRP